jgi:hypothetical protein
MKWRMARAHLARQQPARKIAMAAIASSK